jgi:hypothetical protein
MRSILGWMAVCLFGTLWTVNGLIMVISPRIWFRLPTWTGVHGRLTKEKYSSGPASIEVRLLGAIVVAATAWVAYDAFWRP